MREMHGGDAEVLRPWSAGAQEEKCEEDNESVPHEAARMTKGSPAGSTVAPVVLDGARA